MKKRILYFIGGFVLLVFACTPIEKRETMGPLLAPEDIELNVYQTTAGGNQIVLINNTPMVGGTWDYVIAKSERQQDTILLPFLGTTAIKFYATSPGGIVTVTKNIVVTTIDHPLNPMWAYLAGTGTKNWVWNTDWALSGTTPGGNPAGPWGNGSYKNHWAPGWWSPGNAELTTSNVINDVMTFDLNGGANFTLVTGNTAQGGGLPKGPQAGTYHGTFLYDMTQTMNGDNGLPWLLGKLTLTTPVSYGFYPNEAGYTWIYQYYFTKINANEMVLCAPDPGASSSWAECWFFMFKKQGFTYPPK